jgi:hypothetical protein
MKPLVTALVAMTVACREPNRFVAFLAQIWGWTPLTDGPIDTKLETLWGIAPGNAGDRYTIMRSPDANRGMVRIVGGADRERTRQRATRWGGFELVVMSDIEGL